MEYGFNMSENEYGPRERTPTIIKVNVFKVWSFIRKVFKKKAGRT